MKSLTGIMICSTCGGYARRTCISQEPRERFNVGFYCSGRRGLTSLELLIGAFDYVDPEPTVGVGNMGDIGHRASLPHQWPPHPGSVGGLDRGPTNGASLPATVFAYLVANQSVVTG